jgi:hypothetical protein
MATHTLATPPVIGSSNPTKVYLNFIDGEWVESSTGETFENRNPADTRDLVGVFQKSGKADVDAAVDAAKRAFASGDSSQRRGEPRSFSAPPKSSSSAKKSTPAT